MSIRVLSQRQRLRRWVAARGAFAAQFIGNRPVFGGLSGTAVATVMAALTFHAIYAARADEFRYAAGNSSNIVTIVDDDLERNFELYDLSLQAVVSGAENAGTWTLPAPLRQRVLFDRATVASYLGGAYVVDAQGRVKASQTGRVDAAVSLADRDYFIAQQRDPSVGLYISHPYRSRLRNGVQTVGLTRRINAPDGTFDGVALLGIRIEYFQRLLDQVNAGAHGRVFIMLDDGVMLADKPAIPGRVGADYSGSRNFAIMASHASGTFTARSSIDGVERMFTYARVGDTRLIVCVAPAVDDVLAGWRRRSLLAIVMTTVIGGAYVAVSWLLAFALRDKLVAEARLLRLAVTDPLTGLANRRALDVRLAEEWQRAVRDCVPLSVLFVDIDHFKRFNDTYGHAAGDEVLTVVAQRIVSGVRRLPDMVARYGGEEFAVVLPGAPAASAWRVAEKLRRRVEAANLANRETAYGRVTISVGCATCHPPEGGSPAKLVAAADAQLYVAKEAGRNQVRATEIMGADEPEAPPLAGQREVG
ncbi:diguanylate cyclase [Burkholderia sp. WAC0059]|uniref:GGDEF domain-containing protein n=1 Tax=Burkholderia sp. WAC0059 TaxID=2066022 RepID=UPI000C7EE662|nr:diguanylate cyclase [Burkholderia sp. WAC0059]PLZ04228.1 diguanylate cyclase [Burkholderia sp. WAC0059]